MKGRLAFTKGASQIAGRGNKPLVWGGARGSVTKKCQRRRRRTWAPIMAATSFPMSAGECDARSEYTIRGTPSHCPQVMVGRRISAQGRIQPFCLRELYRGRVIADCYQPQINSARSLFPSKIGQNGRIPLRIANGSTGAWMGGWNCGRENAPI